MIHGFLENGLSDLISHTSCTCKLSSLKHQVSSLCVRLDFEKIDIILKRGVSFTVVMVTAVPWKPMNENARFRWRSTKEIEAVFFSKF